MIFKFIKKYLFLVLLIIFTVPGLVLAELREISDLSLTDFSLTTTQEEQMSFSFLLKNNSNVTESGLKYGLYLKNELNSIKDKVIFEESITLLAGQSVVKNIDYKGNTKDIKKVILFISSGSGLPLATAILDDIQISDDNISEVIEDKNKNTNYIKNCILSPEENGVILSCESNITSIKDNADLTNVDIEIFHKNIFGNSLKKDTLEPEAVSGGYIVYKAPIMKPGFYEMSVKTISNKEFIKFKQEGDFFDIYKLNLDKESYDEFEKAKITIFIASNNSNDFNYLFGVKDNQNKNCGVTTQKGNLEEVSIFLKRVCNGAEPFLVVTNKNGEEVASYGSKGEDIKEKFSLKKFILDLSQHNTYIYSAIMLVILIAVLALLRKRTTFSIAVIIIFLFILFGYFGANQILAKTYASERNMFTIDFSKSEHTEDDEIALSVGVFDINSLEKEKGTSVAISINNEAYNEVISSDDEDEVHKISIGKKRPGRHNIKVRTTTKSTYGGSSYGRSYFGETSSEISYYFDVYSRDSDPNSRHGLSGIIEEGDMTNLNICANGENPIDDKCVYSDDLLENRENGQGNCKNTTWSPSTDAYCRDESFIQTSNCGETRTVKATNDSSTCAHTAEVIFECSLDNIRWNKCDAGIIRILSTAKIYVRVSSGADKIVAWSVKDGGGGLKPEYVNGEIGLESVHINAKPMGNGLYGKGKFFTLDVKAIGLTADYASIDIMVLNPRVNEI